MERSPVGSSQSNGSIENAVASAEARVRVIRLALARRVLARALKSHPVAPWLTARVGFVIERCAFERDSGSLCFIGRDKNRMMGLFWISGEQRVSRSP